MKALVTGASSGIGRDLAIELSMYGYDLILVSRNKEKLEEVAKQINTNTKIIAMNLEDEDNCKKLYDELKNDDIDILVNNAGFGLKGEFVNADLDKEIRMIKTNITAVHILTKLFLKDMVEKNKGTILNVASIAGFMPGPLMSTYYSTKAYVVRLSEAIKEELKQKKSNVQISVLCPGPVDTNFNKVSGADFKVKSLSSQYVAKYTIKKMFKGKFIIVPGTAIKALRPLAKIMPNNLIMKFVYKVH